MTKRLNEIVKEYTELRCVTANEVKWNQGKLLAEARGHFLVDKDFGYWRSLNFNDLKQPTAYNLMNLARLTDWKMIKEIGLTSSYRLEAPAVEALNEAWEAGDMESFKAGLPSKPKPKPKPAGDAELIEQIKLLTAEVERLKAREEERNLRATFQMEVIQGDKNPECFPDIRFSHADPVWAIGLDNRNGEAPTRRDVRRAYKKMSLQTHPDKGAAPHWQIELKELERRALKMAVN